MGDIERVNTDILHAILTNSFSGGSVDGLNSNPWWYTNSNFTTWAQFADQVLPHDTGNLSAKMTFPEFLSWWGMQLAPDTVRNPATQQNWINGWGLTRQGSTPSDRYKRSFTWFDWVSEFAKSNMIATSAVDTNELSRWAEQSGADYVDEFTSDTNKVAIGHTITNGLDDLISEITDTSDGADDEARQLLEQFDFTEMFPSSFTGADPQLLIFPESTIGGVHVGNVVGTIELPVSVSVWVRRVAEFCYGCLLFVSVLRLTKTEYAYWTSLGNTEGADA